MKITRFEDILSWQKAQDLAVRVYDLFSDLKDFEFRNQIKSAVVSISNNISEGFERGSDADFIRMLYFAKGSSGEVMSMTYLAFRLRFISETQKIELLQSSNEISRLIASLIKRLGVKEEGYSKMLVQLLAGTRNDQRLTTND